MGDNKLKRNILIIGQQRTDAVTTGLLEWFKHRDDFNFHFITGDYPNSPGKMKPILTNGQKINVNMAAFIDETVLYVKKENITGVTAYHDIDMILAAIVSERCGLPGPSPQSVFLCHHKYYARLCEKPKLWFEGIDLNNDVEWRSKMRYPCWVKPVCLMCTIGGRRIDSEKEMEAALRFFRKTLSEVVNFFEIIFSMAVNKAEYPLASKIMLIAEELVEGDDVTQHCVEGWADKDGNFNLFEVDDDVISDTTVFNSEMIPSTMSHEERTLAVNESKNLVHSVGLRSCPFIVEVFLRNVGGKPRVDSIEINQRPCPTHHFPQNGIRGISLSVIAVFVACGIDTEAKASLVNLGQFGKENKFAMLCNFQARKSGVMSELVDLDAVEYYRETPQENVYGINHSSGVVLEFPEDHHIELPPEGFRIGFFVLFGNNPIELQKRANVVRSKIVKI